MVSAYSSASRPISRSAIRLYVLDRRYVPALLFVALLVLGGAYAVGQTLQPSDCGVDTPPLCPVSEHPQTVELHNLGTDTDSVTVTLVDRERGDVLHRDTYDVGTTLDEDERIETGIAIDEAGSYTLRASVADGGSAKTRWDVPERVGAGGPRRVVTVHANDSVTIDANSLP